MRARLTANLQRDQAGPQQNREAVRSSARRGGQSWERRRRPLPRVARGSHSRRRPLQPWVMWSPCSNSGGGPHYCWCMVWRGAPAERRSKEQRKAALCTRIKSDTPVGLVAYRNGKPVAWVSIALRSTYRTLTGSTELAEEEGVWSLVCFFLPRPMRGHGYARQLLKGAIEYAREAGAKVVEAYPVDPESPSYRFMGVVSLFEAAGFAHVGKAGSRRYIMRLDLGADPSSHSA